MVDDSKPKLLWNPTKEDKSQSNISDYLRWLSKTQGLSFETYEDLWSWSSSYPELFWEGLLKYFEVQYAGSYLQVLSSCEMPGAKWFEGISLNYVEHMHRHFRERDTAIIWKTELKPTAEISAGTLRKSVASLQEYLSELGVGPGDRVAGFMANIPEASIAFQATAGLGAIWSGCSPDFGVGSVVDRFQQIEPKVLIAVDGYTYNGKEYPKVKEIKSVAEKLPTLEKIIIVPVLGNVDFPDFWQYWDDIAVSNSEPIFRKVPFDHPIWVLYSSGTTGNPKAITHSHGGVLLEHLKYLIFHNDVRKRERFFWYSTTGWMMWNFVQASMLAGAAMVLYDGSPSYPNLKAMWSFTQEVAINHFGTSAPFLVACMKRGLQPGRNFDLSNLRSIGSTGSPLPSDAFDWVYEQVKSNVWLCSMSGGTDVCTAFVGGIPLKPVYEGEIQCRALGCDLHAYNDKAQPVTNEVGEMVICKPMPSMPIYFWNDPEMKRYKSSYFETFEGVWRHGDWVSVNDRGGLVIYGRSDATLNRQGVRIGTSEIYRAMNTISEIKDSLIVNLELEGGKHYMPLFVMLKDGVILNEGLKARIKNTLRQNYSPRHVPDEIVEVGDIPYTISGKKMEAPVKKILLGRPLEKSINLDSMRNPECVRIYLDLAKKIK